jgi:hypothetical protein
MITEICENEFNLFEYTIEKITTNSNFDKYSLLVELIKNCITSNNM